MEKWRSIVGYEGKYEVSNYGNVRSVDRIDRTNHFRKGKILTLRTDKDGYKIAVLSNGIHKFLKVHRLVAIAFIPNPENLPEVNHKNEVKDDNFIDNLEWCTAKYNANYGNRNIKISQRQKGKPNIHCQGEKNYFYGKCFRGKDNIHSRAVKQYTQDGVLVNKYECMKEAGKAVGVTPSAISLGCRGLRKTIKGFVWKYA